MYNLIIFFPLLGSIAAGLFGRFLGGKGASILTIIGMVLSTLLSLIACYQIIILGNPIYIHFLTWIESELFETNWGFTFDSLTVIMLLVITIVSTLVHIYSTEYMGGDPHLPRFMSYLSLFTFFMLMLVTADNLIQLFFGWEGVGVSSYLLINFWYTRIPANKAAIKAMVVNRVGDFGLTIGILTIFLVFYSVDFATIFAILPYFVDTHIIFFNQTFNIFNIICFCLFIGAVGKSAQIGLHTWLPDAMEGPTPVSALIHAATMVTAGVFLILRCSPLFEYAPNVLLIITFMGASTALFAATAGLLQNDLKKVIAYSTCSQLGYMVFACGISNYSVSIFHLMNHAFFKALLFLSAGSIIHAMSDEQDMRKMGGIIKFLPFTYSMMLTGSLSLMGFPFLTGFYSKDVILELAFAKYTIDSTFAYWFGTIAAFFTAFYSFRLIYLTFIANTNAYKKVVEHAHDAPIRMAIPLIILVFGSIFIGYITRDLIIGLGTDFWGNSLNTLTHNVNIIDSEFIPYYIKLIPVIFSLIGAGLALILNVYFDKLLYLIKLNYFGNLMYGFFNKKWYFDHVYNEYIVKNVLNFGYHITFKTIDRGVVELIGPYGIAQGVKNFAKKISNLQTGLLYHYALMILIGSVLFITLLEFKNFFSLYIDYRIFLIFGFLVILYTSQLKNK